MIESFYIAAYWYNRTQTAEECAIQLLMLMSQVANHDPSLASWYLTGETPEKALKNSVSLAAHTESITTLIKKCSGVKQQAGGGFRFSLWNGLDDENGCSLTSICGSHSTRLANNFILTLPYAEQVSQKLLSIESICSLAEQIVSIVEPHWLKVSSSKIDDFVAEKGLNSEIGWATFRNGVRVSTINLPPSVYVKDCGMKGDLLFASSDARTLGTSTELANLIVISDIYNREHIR